MDKKTFIKRMERLIKLKEEVEKINDVLRKSIINDTHSSLIGVGWYEDLLVDVLADAMEDDSEWISYWIYYLNFGKEHKRLKVKKDGKVIPMKTLSNLYDCINNK